MIETTAKYRSDESEARMRREFYSVDAAAEFKREFWPADPFETGILVDACYLDILDLVAIYKAAKSLERNGNEAFGNKLIIYKRNRNPNQVFLSDRVDWNALVRVNPLWLEVKRQRKAEICQLLHAFYSENCQVFAEKWRQVIETQDAQLREYLQQAKESLQITEQEMEVIVDES